uniref:Link domain-containing protein n=1 Tax=viral metagenome TaxID=1070528 RepID=A0A6C0CTV5_9ZZZZ
MEVTTSSTVEPQNMYNYINSLFMNPIIIGIFALVFVLYFVFFLSLGKNNNSRIFNSNSNMSSSSGSSSNSLEEGIFSSIGLGSNSSSGPGTASLSSTVTNKTSSSSSFITNFLTVLIIVIFIILLVINGVQYYFGVDIVAKFKDLFGQNPQLDVKVVEKEKKEGDKKGFPRIRKPVLKEEVFNIPGNYFNYDDAKSLCQAQGARLATYSEVEDAYNSGAEWCNYGWSEGQMALFPTQQTTYDGLQKIKGHENDCGRPGVNGGYMANPEIQYGVNCYGYKPKMTKEEEELMNTSTPYPKTEKDLEMERRVNYWKTKLDEILVSPFNYTSWSRV